MTELTREQKKALHHCPTCGHLTVSHDAGGCSPCTLFDFDTPTGMGPCADAQPPFVAQISYVAVAGLLEREVGAVLDRLEALAETKADWAKRLQVSSAPGAGLIAGVHARHAEQLRELVAEVRGAAGNC